MGPPTNSASVTAWCPGIRAGAAPERAPPPVSSDLSHHRLWVRTAAMMAQIVICAVNVNACNASPAGCEKGLPPMNADARRLKTELLSALVGVYRLLAGALLACHRGFSSDHEELPA